MWVPSLGWEDPLEEGRLENSRGQRSLLGYSLLDHEESDMTEVM